jgi:hypothetical protein
LKCHLVEGQVGYDALETSVFIFQRFESPRLANFQPAILAFPLVESAFTHAVFAAYLDDTATCFGLLEDADDLFLIPFCSWHLCSPLLYFSRGTLHKNGILYREQVIAALNMTKIYTLLFY